MVGWCWMVILGSWVNPTKRVQGTPISSISTVHEHVYTMSPKLKWLINHHVTRWKWQFQGVPPLLDTPFFLTWDPWRNSQSFIWPATTGEMTWYHRQLGTHATVLCGYHHEIMVNWGSTTFSCARTIAMHHETNDFESSWESHIPQPMMNHDEPC